NWRGSAGGQTQLFFGSDSSGLTSLQLSRIKFVFPGAVIYSARILPTGEVVPEQAPPFLGFARSGNTLILTWPPGWTLQSSANVTGPYQDVQGATSPYPTLMSSPSQFFRLRQ